MHLKQGNMADESSSSESVTHDFQNGDIREFHFHVYFFFNSPKDVELALALHDQLVAQVAAGAFVAVCHGVTSEMIPGLNEAAIPPINRHPIGPHPCGSFEVWVPDISFSAVQSWFMLNRGNLSILVHPLTDHVLLDHTERALWLGPPFRLNLGAFSSHGKDEPQYPELKLGYNSPSKE